MKKKILLILIGFIVIMIILIFIAYYNTPLKTLEKDVSSIALPENIEKVSYKKCDRRFWWKWRLFNLSRCIGG